MPTAPIATAAAAATRPLVSQVRRRWVRRTRRTSAGSSVSGTGCGGSVGIDDLDREPGQQSGQPGELADRARAVGAAGEVPLEGDPVLGGEGAQDIGAVPLLELGTSCADPHLFQGQPQGSQRVVGPALHCPLGHAEPA